MEREQDFEFGHSCPHCGGEIKTTVSVQASTDGGGIHLVVQEKIEEL